MDSLLQPITDEAQSTDTEKETTPNQTFQIIPSDSQSRISTWLPSWTTTLAFRVQSQPTHTTAPTQIYNIWHPSTLGISLPRKNFPSVNLYQKDLLISKENTSTAAFRPETVISGINVSHPPFYACKHCLRLRGWIYLADGSRLRFDDENEGEMYQFHADPGVTVGGLVWKPDVKDSKSPWEREDEDRLICRRAGDRGNGGAALAVLVKGGITLLRDVIEMEKASGKRVDGEQILMTGIALAFYRGWII